MVNCFGRSRGGSAKISVFDFSEVKNIHTIGKQAKTRPTASPRWIRIVGSTLLPGERVAIATSPSGA